VWWKEGQRCLLERALPVILVLLDFLHGIVTKSEVIMSRYLFWRHPAPANPPSSRNIRELKRKDHRGTIKHPTMILRDKPGKDTWRHAQAGADAVAPSSPSKLPDPESGGEKASAVVAELLGTVDILGRIQAGR
jgi:hypothetical protein